MKRFLINTFVVFVALFGVMSLLDAWITYNLHHSKANVFQGMNDVFFDSTYYDLVIMGSSRGLFQYDTRVLDSVLNIQSYNAGINGRGIISQIIKYRMYEKRHGTPKVIVQNIDCFLLAEDNGFEREQYLPYFFDKELFEMIKQREEGLGLSNKLPESKTYHGYSPSFASWDGTKLERTKEVGFSKDPEPVAEFRNYLRECRDKGIKVVFVYAPFFSGAQEKMSDNTLKDMKNLFEKLGEEYNVPILSWWESPICCDTNFF